MNLYLLSQDENNDYDTYDACVVAAENEDAARLINPTNGPWGEKYSSWCSSPDKVKIDLIGEAKEGTAVGVILGSFNAG